MNQPANKITGLRGFFTKHPRALGGIFGTGIGAAVGYEMSGEQTRGRNALIGGGLLGTVTAAMPPQRAEKLLTSLEKYLG